MEAKQTNMNSKKNQPPAWLDRLFKDTREFFEDDGQSKIKEYSISSRKEANTIIQQFRENTANWTQSPGRQQTIGELLSGTSYSDITTLVQELNDQTSLQFNALTFYYAYRISPETVPERCAKYYQKYVDSDPQENNKLDEFLGADSTVNQDEYIKFCAKVANHLNLDKTTYLIELSSKFAASDATAKLTLEYIERYNDLLSDVDISLSSLRYTLDYLNEALFVLADTDPNRIESMVARADDELLLSMKNELETGTIKLGQLDIEEMQWRLIRYLFENYTINTVSVDKRFGKTINCFNEYHEFNRLACDKNYTALAKAALQKPIEKALDLARALARNGRTLDGVLVEYTKKITGDITHRGDAAIIEEAVENYHKQIVVDLLNVCDDTVIADVIKENINEAFLKALLSNEKLKKQYAIKELILEQIIQLPQSGYFLPLLKEKFNIIPGEYVYVFERLDKPDIDEQAIQWLENNKPASATALSV